MALRQKRQFRTFALPEFLALASIGVAIVPVTLWLLERSDSEYRRAAGEATSCEIQSSADSAKKVIVTYQYSVGAETYTHAWTGLWPETGSPNALPPEQLDKLRHKHHPLTVFYDPDNPRESYLHVADRGFEHFYGGLAVGMCLVAVLYCGIAYPAWRST